MEKETEMKVCNCEYVCVWKVRGERAALCDSGSDSSMLKHDARSVLTHTRVSAERPVDQQNFQQSAAKNTPVSCGSANSRQGLINTQSTDT